MRRKSYHGTSVTVHASASTVEGGRHDMRTIHPARCVIAGVPVTATPPLRGDPGIRDRGQQQARPAAHMAPADLVLG